MGNIALWSVLIGGIAVLVYAASGLFIISSFVIPLPFIPASYNIFLLSNLAIVSCIAVFLFDTGPNTKYKNNVIYRPLKKNAKISVVMTAYNDEKSVKGAVKDFKNNMVPYKAHEIVVVDNNCKDRTAKFAKEAGARVVKEPNQGYGWACQRALKSARGDIIILTESDGTFEAYDAKKFIDYLENADLVIGSRTTRELLDQNSQLNWFLTWGNIFLAKMIQIRYWRKTRLTDAACTYRAMRKETYEKIKDKITYGGNDWALATTIVALDSGLKVLEIPITLRKRVGESKAIGRNRIKGIKLGLRMLWDIITY
ncbi:glycosyltransferase family 2 protein [archaeon]|nr:MAG: glycosyltransferase family 2 protein [archaeon]